MPARLWTASQLAAFLKVNVNWVYRHKREIPLIQLSPRLIRYDPDSEEFQAWLRGYGIQPPEPTLSGATAGERVN